MGSWQASRGSGDRWMGAPPLHLLPGPSWDPGAWAPAVGGGRWEPLGVVASPHRWGAAVCRGRPQGAGAEEGGRGGGGGCRKPQAQRREEGRQAGGGGDSRTLTPRPCSRGRPGEPYVTIKAYTAQMEDEVSLQEGETIDVIHKLLDGWWVVR